MTDPYLIPSSSQIAVPPPSSHEPEFEGLVSDEILQLEEMDCIAKSDQVAGTTNFA